MTWRAVLAVILAVVFALAAGSMICCETPPADAAEPELPLSGEALWRSLPAELLSNVAEGKMEEISACQDRIRRLEADLVRVQEIQKAKMSEGRPPPEE